MSFSGAGNWPPALLTSPSIRPPHFSTPSIAAFTWASSRRSAAKVKVSGSPSSSFTWSSLSCVRPIKASRAPSDVQLVRGAAADARAAAGDDDGLALEQAGTEDGVVGCSCIGLPARPCRAGRAPRCSRRMKAKPSCSGTPNSRMPMANSTSRSPSDGSSSASRRMTEMPSVTPIAAAAPDDITSTKKARVMLGRNSSAPSGEPRRHAAAPRRRRRRHRRPNRAPATPPPS